MLKILNCAPEFHKSKKLPNTICYLSCTINVMDTQSDLTVYYDGLCRVCSFEIDHYKKKNIENKIRFVDITSMDFSEEAEGLKGHNYHKHIHARTADGQLVKGVDVFLEVWKVLPGFSVLKKIISNSLLRPAFDLGYKAFAQVRPYLPKKSKAHCDNDRCQT